MIVVTGMHRSGTSFFAKLLFELGGNLGPYSLLLGADEFNEKGYYENKEIFSLNEKLIHGPFDYSTKYWETRDQRRSLLMSLLRMASGSRYFFSPNKKTIFERAQRYKAEIDRLSRKYNHVIVKDPRFSLTIGVWAKYEKVEKILYCYRHPFEVAMSLRRRDYVPLLIGYRLWCNHVKTFFEQAKGLRIIIVNFNNFFEEGIKQNEMKRIFNFLEMDFSELESKRLLPRVLDDKIKHYIHKNEKMPSGCDRIYRSLVGYHQVFSTLQPF